MLDELHIQLGEGPNGYKAQFKDVQARGISGVQVIGLRSLVKDDEVQLQLTIGIPKIHATAKYHSSGQLLLYKASGGGDYWGEYCTYISRTASNNYNYYTYNALEFFFFKFFFR